MFVGIKAVRPDSVELRFWAASILALADLFLDSRSISVSTIAASIEIYPT